jgi:hypothetical protein
MSKAEGTETQAAVETGGVHDCETAEDFLDKLSPRNAWWQPNPPDWVFRGQAKNWPLLPKAYRPHPPDPFARFGVSCAENDYESRSVTIERALKNSLKNFRSAVDRAGLSFPSRLGPFLEDFELAIDNDLVHELPAIALAQHLGLPTQLLDWTERPRVAAYFAAIDAAAEGMSGARLEVWALNGEFVRHARYADTGVRMALVKAARAGNPNLHAQAGVFTVTEGLDAHQKTVNSVMESVTHEFRTVIEAQNRKLPLMRRLTLPQVQAARLLRLLAHEGIDGSTLFPGFEGVVKGMRERALCDK